jgi:BolA protein
MTYAERIRDKLTAAFAPQELDIADDSARHAGHAGARPGGETHFTVTMVSDRFAGQSRIERQRAVHRVLADELKTQVHALALNLATPEEAGGR